MKKIAVLGSTGSIGTQTLDIVRNFPDEFSILGLSGWTNSTLLMEQAWEFRPRYIYAQKQLFRGELPPGCQLVSNLEEIVCNPDVELVVQGLMGNSGLIPTLRALESGKQVALANKEPMVIAGQLLMAQANNFNSQILPLDSEPSAIWQCLRGEDLVQGLKKLIITGSGGPFRETPVGILDTMGPSEALKHPTWHMGPKITIDSATLINKAFEVIEARWLFDVIWDQISVVIHPQSIIHSMVEFKDGSVKAQLSSPDMRLPIQHALFYPQRFNNSSIPSFDPITVKALTFEELDESRYPLFPLALKAGKSGGTYPAVLSAADEIAVEQFLKKRIKFMDIFRLIDKALQQHHSVANPTIEDILIADQWARNTVKQELATLS